MRPEVQVPVRRRVARLIHALRQLDDGSGVVLVGEKRLAEMTGMSGETIRRASRDAVRLLHLKKNRDGRTHMVEYDLRNLRAIYGEANPVKRDIAQPKSDESSRMERMADAATENPVSAQESGHSEMAGIDAAGENAVKIEESGQANRRNDPDESENPVTRGLIQYNTEIISRKNTYSEATLPGFSEDDVTTVREYAKVAVESNDFTVLTDAIGDYGSLLSAAVDVVVFDEELSLDTRKMIADALGFAGYFEFSGIRQVFGDEMGPAVASGLCRRGELLQVQRNRRRLVA